METRDEVLTSGWSATPSNILPRFQALGDRLTYPAVIVEQPGHVRRHSGDLTLPVGWCPVSKCPSGDRKMRRGRDEYITLIISDDVQSDSGSLPSNSGSDHPIINRS